VIGGDFNTNHDQAMFAAERTLDSLADAGYQNGFEGLALSERVTHPANHGFPDATFDFIFAKGLTVLQPTITRTTASDQRVVSDKKHCGPPVTCHSSLVTGIFAPAKIP
jgi:endonuclease/exonuclease/phosphatase (EEP) superfamily protein YafD